MELVGQPFKVVLAYSTAVVECQCDAKHLIALHGLNRPSQCPACQKVYAIAKSGTLSVGQVTNIPDAPRVSLG